MATIAFGIIFAIMGVGVPGYFIAQPLAIMRWRGGWRKAAMAPLLLTVPAIPYSIMGIIHDSNLWPLPVMLVLGLSTVYLGVLWAAKAWLQRG